MPKPEILNTGFKIDEPKLWAVDLPVEEILISEIEYNSEIPYLEKEGTDDWNLTPLMLVKNSDAEPSHRERMDRVNLKFPIDIYRNDNFNKWIILDGVHRYSKALSLGRKTIMVRRVPEDVVKKITRE
jgi:hypothetical protein